MKDVKLNLGCGNKKLSGYINVDWKKTSATEVIHNLNKFPYPFKNNSVDEVLLDNILEHLESVIGVMKELHRICKPGAIVKIFVPYAKSDGAFKDPTHKNFFIEKTFQYFEPNYPLNFYSNARFSVLNIKHLCHSERLAQKLRNCIPFRGFFKYFLMNMYDELYFELKCIK